MAPHDGVPGPQQRLLDWYDRHRRSLPWRTHPIPYTVLVSELMLQQTQVDRVIPYYERFVARFPTFQALAAAPRADVVRLWSGLGYNRRAVHLHEAARIVVEHHGGELPADRDALQALPGVGRYTAGAILSIAFGLSEPAPDTNARRVIGRFAVEEGASDSAVDAAAWALVPAERSGDWNQALMDLGSAVCLSRKPRCLICPLLASCGSAGGVRPPRPKRQKPAEDFAGSSRFYRGRFLAVLASVPDGAVRPLTSVADQLASVGVAEPRPGWTAIAESLARDGLARIEPMADGLGVGLA